MQYSDLSIICCYSFSLLSGNISGLMLPFSSFIFHRNYPRWSLPSVSWHFLPIVFFSLVMLWTNWFVPNPLQPHGCLEGVHRLHPSNSTDYHQQVGEVSWPHIPWGDVHPQGAHYGSSPWTAVVPVQSAAHGRWGERASFTLSPHPHKNQRQSPLSQYDSEDTGSIKTMLFIVYMVAEWYYSQSFFWP